MQFNRRDALVVGHGCRKAIGAIGVGRVEWKIGFFDKGRAGRRRAEGKVDIGCDRADRIGTDRPDFNARRVDFNAHNLGIFLLKHIVVELFFKIPFEWLGKNAAEILRRNPPVVGFNRNVIIPRGQAENFVSSIFARARRTRHRTGDKGLCVCPIRHHMHAKGRPIRTDDLPTYAAG